MPALLLGLLANPTVLIVLAGLLGSGALYVKGRWDGSAACEARVAVAAQRERSRQADINQRAIDAANERAGFIAAENERLNNILQENIHEAADDPDADSCGVSADGVRRLNRIR